MPLVCKWKTTCNHCSEVIEVGDDLWLVETLTFGKERICHLCAWLDGYSCVCGNGKKPEHDTCWDCKVEQEKRDGTRCGCGNWKKPQYATCWSCKMAPQP